MPSFLRYLLVRFLAVPFTLLVITMTLYGFVMLTPPEARAELYITEGNSPAFTEERRQAMIERAIQKYHLRDPYPVQYAIWAGSLLRGEWGWSPVLNDDVLLALLRRTPVTAELTLYSLLAFIPLGIISGVLAGRRRGDSFDHSFRFAAFTVTSMPPFILALILLAIFYVGLYWFPPERVSIATGQVIKSAEFFNYTGLVTIDGLLNGRPDITLEALRHLVLPVTTLSLLHWATLGRVTRAAMIEEMQKEYILAGKAHGLRQRSLVWKHAFRNTLAPALTSSSLSAASLITGVYVVESIFNFRGISDVILASSRGVPDAPTVMGFAIYSVVMVVLLMFVADLVQAFLDPRIRQGVLES